MIGHQQFYPYQYYPQMVQPMQGVQQPMQQPVQQPVQQTAPQTIQNGGFVSVRTEKEIETYPVAPGNVVTFKLENQPYVVEKTQGFSQFEAPRYKRWRMVEEEAPVVVDAPIKQPEPSPEYALREDIDRLDGEIAEIRGQITKKRPAKKEEEKDDD